MYKHWHHIFFYQFLDLLGITNLVNTKTCQNCLCTGRNFLFLHMVAIARPSKTWKKERKPKKRFSHHGESGEKNSILVAGKKPPQKGAPRNCYILAFALNIVLQKNPSFFSEPLLFIAMLSVPFTVPDHSKYSLMKKGQCSFLRGKQMLFKHISFAGAM